MRDYSTYTIDEDTLACYEFDRLLNIEKVSLQEAMSFVAERFDRTKVAVIHRYQKKYKHRIKNGFNDWNAEEVAVMELEMRRLKNESLSYESYLN